jgi:hypothetical protein
MATKARRPGTKPTVHRLPVTQARINLGAVIKRARLHKEYFILEKDGIPVVGLMDIDEFEDYLEQQDPVVRAHIHASAREYRAGQSRPATAFMTQLRKASARKNSARRPA